VDGRGAVLRGAVRAGRAGAARGTRLLAAYGAALRSLMYISLLPN
jgi:hypothetical protein